MYFLLHRYSKNLQSARKMGIYKGFINGASLGSMFLIMFSTYGLAFWYGSTLIFDEIITVGNMLTAFFGILIGSITLGLVSTDTL